MGNLVSELECRQPNTKLSFESSLIEVSGRAEATRRQTGMRRGMSDMCLTEI